MKNVIIGIAIAAVFLEVSGLIWSSKSDTPSEAFVQLSQPPERRLSNPLDNGYFLLVGFPAAPSADPVHIGYDIWLESNSKPTERFFNYDKAGRTDLRLPVSADEAFAAWHAADPLAAFQEPDSLFRTGIDRYAVLLKRYERWLGMPFEDWGFAHRGTPRFEELLLIHRLYVAAGFVRESALGTERLKRDLSAWRAVLREARTLSMKVMAQLMIEDDVRFLSRLLEHPTVDRNLIVSLTPAVQPLTATEYSLNWSIRNQFVLGLTRDQTVELDGVLSDNRPDERQVWLAKAAQLHPEAFQRIEHPHRAKLMGVALHTQSTWDTYAAYYEATIKAAESVHSPLPKLHDIARESSRTAIDAVLNPLQFEPDWEPFSQRLVETDARLRLVSLQILLRKPGTTASVPNRLAELGPSYFDPFSGLPMLWSPTQQKIYSVGKDGLDDGGDASFDISAPVVLGAVSAAPRPDTSPVSRKKSPRRA